MIFQQNSDSLQNYLELPLQWSVSLIFYMRNILLVNSKPGRRSGVSGSSPLSQKLQELYSVILEHKDNRGRVLSAPFVVLPSKAVSQCVEFLMNGFRVTRNVNYENSAIGFKYQKCEVICTKYQETVICQF